MLRISRRMMLGGMVGAAGALLGSRFRLALGSEVKGAERGPRYFVLISPTGGMDTIFTFDPRRKSEIAPNISLTYPDSGIVNVGSERVGPHMAAVKAHVPSMSILRGVQVRTAGHPSGIAQIIRCRTNVTPACPSLLDLLGQGRTTQAVGSVALAAGAEHYSPGALRGVGPLNDPEGKPDPLLFRELDGRSPEDLRLVARVTQKQAEQLSRQGGERARAGDQLAALGRLTARLAELPPFKVDGWGHKGDASWSFERVLYLLEHDLSRATMVAMTALWDTHQENDPKQTRLNTQFFAMLARFFDELEHRKNAYGTLASQTVVIVGSELGRLPYLNARLGKDHFPEIPMMLRGPGLRPGFFGRTGAKLEALPIAMKDGRSPGDHVMLLDDVGTTLLDLGGMDPEALGYGGRRLEFLRA